MLIEGTMLASVRFENEKSKFNPDGPFAQIMAQSWFSGITWPQLYVWIISLETVGSKCIRKSSNGDIVPPANITAFDSLTMDSNFRDGLSSRYFR